MTIKQFLTLTMVVVMFFSTQAIADDTGPFQVSAAIKAAGKWTDAIYPAWTDDRSAITDEIAARSDFGTLFLSISWTWVGTVTLQKSYDGGSTWIATGDTWTANTSQIIYCYEPGVMFRIGIATGDYTSGTCNVRLSK